MISRSIPRSFALALALFACHSSAPPAEPTRCPGPYPITPGICEAVPATDCHGVCGVVLRRAGCTPVDHANIIVDGANPSGATDRTGRFEIVGLAAGHYNARVMAEQDVGLFELDVTTDPKTLAAPLEVTLIDRSCACGGLCVGSR